MLIDAHCHLTAFADTSAVLAESRAAGVSAFVSAATDRASWKPLVTLRNQAPNVAIALGLHPLFEHRLIGADHDLDALEALLDSTPSPMVAVGECGVDKRFESDAQWRLFDAQLGLAEQYGVPIVVHCVQLNDQVAKLLRAHPRLVGGLIHGFSGSPVQAQRFIDQGYVIGIGGAVTFERAQKLKRVVKALPEHGFVLETDAPDMLPASLRGRAEYNVPANLRIVAKEVAALRQITLEQLGECTTANVRRVFGDW
ncbi:TatD family hydrolase [Carnimonas nigrificans]|uniref:TatD family hydrolase n=1 Tax=Carnimonas nigrificans TaxID=64323 RepID=UPI00046F42ED|nr:TatD family hydrolase [Carnimonas nigrificans]